MPEEQPLLRIMASTSLAEEAFQSLVEHELEDTAGGPTSLMLQVALYEPLGRLEQLSCSTIHQKRLLSAAVIDAAARSPSFTVKDEGRALDNGIETGESRRARVWLRSQQPAPGRGRRLADNAQWGAIYLADGPGKTQHLVDLAKCGEPERG